MQQQIVVGGRTCVRGFDWSVWQPIKNLTPAVQEGWSFAVFKATEGNGYVDPKYRGHVNSADSAGLLHGTYHFARPDWYGNSAYNDGRAEAKHILSQLAASEKFIVLDLEATVLNPTQTAQYVVGFWDEVMLSELFPRREQRVTYVGKWFNWEHTQAVANVSVLWIPSYTAGYTPDVDPRFIPLPGWSADLWPEGWDIWQYSSSGTVAGTHPSDVNVATLTWFTAVSGAALIPNEPFKEPEKKDMAQPVYNLNGHHHVLTATDNGFGWRWIPGVNDENHLTLAGVCDPARTITLGIGQGKQNPNDPNAEDVFDATWNSYPVLDGPLKRD